MSLAFMHDVQKAWKQIVQFADFFRKFQKSVKFCPPDVSKYTGRVKQVLKV